MAWRSLVLGSVFLAAGGPAPAAEPDLCAPEAAAAAGWVLEAPQRMVVFGETRGTRQAPALLGEVVCLALAGGAAVTVAIEHPEEASDALESYLGSDGGADARATLLADAVWRQPLQDGRGSAAMLALAERLRLMRAAGGDVRLAGFVPPASKKAQKNQKAQARATADLLARMARRDPDRRIFVLAGSLAAARTLRGPEAPTPVGGFLPAALLVRMADAGGTAWVCAPGPEGLACGERPRPQPRGETLPGGQFIDRGHFTGLFDGAITIGVVSASRPATQEAMSAR